jgi:hypothetical protein
MSEEALDKALLDLLDYCRSNNRVCPKNIYWNAFYSILPDKEGKRPPPPLFVSESGLIYDSLWHLRLSDQIYWAYANDAIEKSGHFLRSLETSGIT